MEKIIDKDRMVYSNMIDLLLEYGNKTEDELVKAAVERFEAPRHEFEHNVTPLLAFKENAGYIEKYKDDGRFHLLDIDFGSNMGRICFAELLSKSPAHLNNPHTKKLKQAFEERGFILK